MKSAIASKWARFLDRLVLAAVIIVLGLVVIEPIDNYRRRSAEGAVSDIIRPLGGRIGSIRALWAKEYAISFQGTQFTPHELDELDVLKRLPAPRSVSLHFGNTNLTESDIQGLRERFPQVDGFSVHCKTESSE